MKSLADRWAEKLISGRGPQGPAQNQRLFSSGTQSRASKRRRWHQNPQQAAGYFTHMNRFTCTGAHDPNWSSISALTGLILILIVILIH